MLLAAMVGGMDWCRNYFQASKQMIQLVMGVAMVVIGFVIILQVANVIPVEGTAIGLSGIKLIVAIVINFFLGAVMTAGVGFYMHPVLPWFCVLVWTRGCLPHHDGILRIPWRRLLRSFRKGRQLQ